MPKAFSFTGKGFRSRGFVTFDRSIFQRNWKAINETPLKKAGLRLRRVMIRLIRKDRSKTQRPSKPGRPPKSRAPGHPFRRVFSLPLGDASVVVGHVGFKRRRFTPMQIHEFGETVRQSVIDTGGRGQRQRRRLKRKRKDRLFTKRGRKISKAQKEAARRLFQTGRLQSKDPKRKIATIKFPKRPFAFPALERTRSQLPPMWRGSVRK